MIAADDKSQPQTAIADTDTKDRTVSLFNRSATRTFDLGFDFKDGSPVERKHAPQASHNYTPEEAKKMKGYKEMIETANVSAAPDLKKALADAKALADENAQLKAMLAAFKGEDQVALPAPEKPAKASKKSQDQLAA